MVFLERLGGSIPSGCRWHVTRSRDCPEEDSMRISARIIAPWAALAALLAFPTPPARAQDDEAIRQTVARVAFVEGDASYSRGDDPDNWQAAAVNMPMTLGDRVYTGEGSRLELQVHGAVV